MKTRFKTKHALLMSLTSLMLCVSMLVGATFAWFTDSVTSGVNRIVSGNLDVEVYHSKEVTVAETDANKVAAATDLFTDKDGNAMKWEPGAVSYENFLVKNAGTLALKYNMALNIAGYNYVTGTTQYDLRTPLKVKVLTGDSILSSVTRETVQGLDWSTGYDKLDSFKKEGGSLYPAGTAGQDSDEKFQVIVYWEPTDTDNNWNVNNDKATNDGKDLYIDFGIALVASQLQYESDSFGADYDASAPLAAVALSQAITESPYSDITIAEQGSVKSATVASAAASALFDEMKSTDSDASNELTLKLSVAQTAQSTTSRDFDIDLTAIMKSTSGGETTTTEQKATDLEDYVTINVQLEAGLANLTATHNGNAMVNSTDTNDDTGSGIYSYDAGTGLLTIKTKSFSPFAVAWQNEGEGTPVTIPADKLDTSENFYYLNSDIVVTAPLNGKTASVTVPAYTDLSYSGEGVATLSLKITKTETTIYGNPAIAYKIAVEGVVGASAFYYNVILPCEFGNNDSLYFTSPNSIIDGTSYVGKFITYSEGKFDFGNMGISEDNVITIAYVDPSLASIVDLADIAASLSVDDTTLKANDANTNGDTVKSTNAVITANNFTLKDLTINPSTGLKIKGNGTTVDGAKITGRSETQNVITLDGLNNTVKDTNITSCDTAISAGDRGALYFTGESQSSYGTTNVENVKISGDLYGVGIAAIQLHGILNIKNADIKMRTEGLRIKSNQTPPSTQALNVTGSTIDSTANYINRTRSATFTDTTFKNTWDNNKIAFTLSDVGTVSTSRLSFNNCTFEVGMNINVGDNGGTAIISFTDCTVGNVPVTTENYTQFFTITRGGTITQCKLVFGDTEIPISF